jgi:hypothetical protein
MKEAGLSSLAFLVKAQELYDGENKKFWHNRSY